jgi:hypothetical protein
MPFERPQQENQESQITLEILRARVKDLEEPVDYYEHEEKIKKLIHDLLQRKEDFAHIFKTEKGSMYFVLPTGESFRMKLSGGHWYPQPITKEIFFVGFEQSQNLKTKWREGNYSEPIPLVDYQVGAAPIEMNLDDGESRNILEKNADTIILKGSRVKLKNHQTGISEEHYSPVPLAPIHRGHAIVEIIK